MQFARQEAIALLVRIVPNESANAFRLLHSKIMFNRCVPLKLVISRPINTGRALANSALAAVSHVSHAGSQHGLPAHAVPCLPLPCGISDFAEQMPQLLKAERNVA